MATLFAKTHIIKRLELPDILATLPLLCMGILRLIMPENHEIGLFSLGFPVRFCCARSRKPPNILPIMADDLGYGGISYACNGSTTIKTTHIDAH